MSYAITHEDIHLRSEQPVSWEQHHDDTLNYENLSINEADYNDYRPTLLQFRLTSEVEVQEIHLEVRLANRLSRTHFKHAELLRYDQTTKDWHPAPQQLNKEIRSIEAELAETGVYCVFVNHYWYSSFTQRMADEYPNWTEIRKSPGSTGQKFLNFFGIELETVKDYLEWIQEQKYISTADVAALDWIQMYSLPEVRKNDELGLTTNEGKAVPILETIKEFFFNELNDGGIVDYQDMRFYTNREYGDLELTITRGNTTSTELVKATDYHIWNTFDEFGMTVGIERKHLEKNADFKERILDVFRYPAGSHDIGLTNGIAQELLLVQRKDAAGKDLVWVDDTKDFYLKNSSGRTIDIRTLRLDNEPLKAGAFEVDAVGGIRIFALHTMKKHHISFIHGIQKHQLYDKSNAGLHRMMFQEDGQATPTLLNWVEYINTVAPVMWGRFNWDEGFWDTIDQKLTGLGYVPNIWDSNIEVWKDYVFQSDR